MKQPENLTDWRFHLGGTLVGNLDNGRRVRTSPVVARNPEENLVQTRSGTVYRLGEHSGKGYPPELMWDENGWAGGEKKPIPRIAIDTR